MLKRLGGYEKSPYFVLNFAMNLKLLLKIKFILKS